MLPTRSGILDMFALYINDDVAYGKENDKIRTSNMLIILTCETYLVYDDRSENERSRVNVGVIIEKQKELAYKSCDDFINRLMAQNNKDKMKILYNRLTDNPCRQKLQKILSNKQTTEFSSDTKIEI